MILVDVQVPVLNESYDFNIDENTPVISVIRELCEVICQHERWPEVSDTNVNMILSCLQLSSILPLDKTLNECGVEPGYRLILT